MDLEEELVLDPAEVLRGLGGSANVQELLPCITRLRAEVANPKLVDQDVLTAAGAVAVIVVDNRVQVVVGPVADQLAAEVNDLR